MQKKEEKKAERMDSVSLKQIPKFSGESTSQSGLQKRQLFVH